MIYDSSLSQYLEHEHPEIGEVLERIVSANEALTIQTNNLQSHITDTGNPHKLKPEQLGSDKPLWNANAIHGAEVDNKHRKHGWALAYNAKTKKLEYFPITNERFFDHNKLKNYDSKEHTPLDDDNVGRATLWSSAKTSKTINESVKLLNKKLDRIEDGANPFVVSGGDFKPRAMDFSLNFGGF